ncbi:TonB family protein [Candidatus Kapabacteria bacterium]|nr:TonB family protein [Candidatus Kapabacteria bacterium]
MYKSTKYESESGISIDIPWDANTAKGWGVSLLILSLIMGSLTLFEIEELQQRKLPETEALVLLNFGDGDGTGLSSGNAQEEGQSQKAPEAQSNLDDAQQSAKTVKTKTESNATLDQTNNIKPVKEIKSKSNELPKPEGQDKKNIGKKGANDDLFASGLGDRGFGKGAGHGFGDIDWGGGGNRRVLSKVIPRYPENVRASSKIVLQIRVLPDGTVSNVISKIKGDPRLEIEAIKALRQWKFNPIDSSVVMIGEVPLTFVRR